MTGVAEQKARLLRLFEEAYNAAFSRIWIEAVDTFTFSPERKAEMRKWTPEQAKAWLRDRRNV